MKRIGWYGTAIVLAHLAVNVVHGLAHAKLHVGLTRGQIDFIVAVILLGPILAMILLWTRLRRAGAWLLLVSMAGSFVFGAYYHFLLNSPDNVSHVSAGSYRMAFQITAVLLALTEALGCWVAAWVLARLQPAQASN
jgi:hypothetical protein